MPRWLFPEDRSVFVFDGPLTPILEPSMQQGIQIFVDPECTTLAIITDVNRALVHGSTVYPGDGGLLPYFYGPPDTTLLYARAIGQTKVYLLAALDAARLTESDLHKVWEAPALPANGERVPPFIWVNTTDNTVYQVVWDDYSDLYSDAYAGYYGTDDGWVPS